MDVVANHTDHPNVAERLKDESLYHERFGVGNWHDRHQVTFGMIGMWDLDTNNPTVQAIINNTSRIEGLWCGWCTLGCYQAHWFAF